MGQLSSFAQFHAASRAGKCARKKKLQLLSRNSKHASSVANLADVTTEPG